MPWRFSRGTLVVYEVGLRLRLFGTVGPTRNHTEPVNGQFRPPVKRIFHVRPVINAFRQFFPADPPVDTCRNDLPGLRIGKFDLDLRRTDERGLFRRQHFQGTDGPQLRDDG